MASLGTKSKSSIFTAEGKDCPIPSMDTLSDTMSGDAIDNTETDTTELVLTKKEAERLLAGTGDPPVTPEDVTSETLYKYFGNGLSGQGWRGEFIPCTEIVQKTKSTMATQFAYYYSLANYMMTTLGFGTIEELINSACPQIGVICSYWNQLSGDWQNISNCITNFQNFKFCTENPMAILNSVDAGLANLENLILSVDGAVDHIMNLAEEVTSWIDKGESISETIDNAIDNLSQVFENGVASIAEKLSNLPESVMNAFMNCQFIQNMFSLPQRILAHCMSVVAIVTSIRSPTCLKDFVTIIRQLRSAVAEMKNAASIIQNAVDQVKSIGNMIKQGNWIGMLGQLNSGSGAAAQAFNIVEHPSSFAAKYPANSAYTTHGGHIIELDNTKDHERIHVQHKKGTSVELSPDGDMHSKVKKDFQLMVDGNVEINSNKLITLTGKEGIKMNYGGTELNMNQSDFKMGGSAGTMNVDDYIVTSTSARVVSATTLTLGSALETSVSATGLLSLSSAVAVKIQAPTISLIAESPAGIQILATTGTIIGIGNGVGFASTINTVIVAAQAGLYGASSANVIGAGVNLIGGL